MKGDLNLPKDAHPGSARPLRAGLMRWGAGCPRLFLTFLLVALTPTPGSFSSPSGVHDSGSFLNFK